MARPASIIRWYSADASATDPQPGRHTFGDSTEQPPVLTRLRRTAAARRFPPLARPGLGLVEHHEHGPVPFAAHRARGGVLDPAATRQHHERRQLRSTPRRRPAGPSRSISSSGTHALRVWSSTPRAPAPTAYGPPTRACRPACRPCPTRQVHVGERFGAREHRQERGPAPALRPGQHRAAVPAVHALARARRGATRTRPARG